METIHQYRRDRLRERLRSRGVDRALITDPSNIFYLSGSKFVPYERFFGLVMDCEHNTWGALLPHLERGKIKDRDIPEILYQDDEDPIERLVDMVGACNVLGVEACSLSLLVATRLKERLRKTTEAINLDLVDISSLVDGLRQRKDAEEIRQLGFAVQNAERCLDQVRAFIEPGRMEREIEFELLRSMLASPNVMDRETIIIQVLSGANSANPHGSAGERKLQVGDPVTIDFVMNHSHYWADITRTFFVGSPTPELERIYRVVLEAQQEAIDRVRPGVPISELDRAAREVIERAGYGRFFIHRTGHGIGLKIHEPPFIHNGNDSVLEEGMAFTIEPGVYIPDLGGVRIEDDVVVTREGGARLSRYPRHLEDMIL